MADLKGKRILISGGGVRIGRAITECLASAGARIAVQYRNSAEEVERFCALLRGEGREVWALPADLEDPDAVPTLLESAFAKLDGLDVLINNAAVFEKRRLLDLDRDHILRQFQTNLFAPWILMVEFARRAGRGRIINLLDQRITGSDNSCGAYLLSKKALAELTQQSALELAPEFTVNAVAPGAVLPPPDGVRERAGRIPLECSISPEEIARAVRFLLNSDAITGQTLFVDGGQHLLGMGE